MTLSPLMPWLTSGSRFLGGSVKGTLHAWPFCCVGVSGLQGGGRRAQGQAGNSHGHGPSGSVPWEAGALHSSP